MGDEHRIPLGTLIEIDGGARLYVLEHRYSCEGEPLYTLGVELDCGETLRSRGWSESRNRAQTRCLYWY